MVGEHKFYKLPEDYTSKESYTSLLVKILSGNIKSSHLFVSISLFCIISMGVAFYFFTMPHSPRTNQPTSSHLTNDNALYSKENSSQSIKTSKSISGGMASDTRNQFINKVSNNALPLPTNSVTSIPVVPQGMHIIVTNKKINPSNSVYQNNVQNSQSFNQNLPTPTPVTQVNIVFQSSNGQTQTYTPPSNPPIQITWGRYTNTSDNYAIDYPINWQVIKSIDNGHEGLSIFPPDATDTSQFAPHIGLGLSEYYSVPTTGNGQIYASNIIVDNLPGLLYTQGQQGNSYVASFFPYQGEYFGLGSSVTTPELLYVFAHMIYSLTFTL